ncbi:molybdopterin molybdotransferase MoeA [Robiginitalea sediminis]|uniref:molybdopterin molybdotransferase MoeA n=1 Tax=Robiginitalea sediminis TaxID=1982593 RepID=UPI000B4A772B|nr:gephyrin-like molybdotransferase Glp [Robiginitalea sediminis]
MKGADQLTPVEKAFEAVLDSVVPLPVELISLESALGRVLATDIETDRDLPPYNRATMDGIAMKASQATAGMMDFPCEGMARAGDAVRMLKNPSNCIEIATGAVVPLGADAVVRYEDLEKTPNGFQIRIHPVRAGQNIHPMGSDAPKGALALKAGVSIGPAEIGVLASVGRSRVPVRKLPKVGVVTSGDELVPVDQQPEAHQIRSSNGYAIATALSGLGITASRHHLPDQPEAIRHTLGELLQTSDALILSGGVSKGKFDFLPDALADLGVNKAFHRVAQRPGKPFWFGVHPASGCRVFSLPGNPVSSFLNFQLYFRGWLRACLGQDQPGLMAELTTEMRNASDLVHFRTVNLLWREGKCLATEVPMNSSGDFLSLARAGGFVRLDPSEHTYPAGSRVPLLPYNPIV